MDIKHICELIEERKDELFSTLGSLVKINSENFVTHGNEKNVAKRVFELFTEMALECDLYSPLDIEDFKSHPDYMDGRGLEDRFNVTAIMRGEKDENGLMLMGHSDTVSIGDEKNWHFPPLLGEVRDGKVLGRGACDDKYALATALFVIKLLKENGFVPKKNLLFSAYSDEEYGGSHGALAATLKYPSQRIVNMDGRAHQVWSCASGGGEFKLFFHKEGAADSALYAARAIPLILDELGEFAKRREAELEANPYYSGTIIPKTSLRYMGIKVGNAGMDLGRGEVHFIFYTVKTREEIKCELDELHLILSKKLAPLGLVVDGIVPNTRFFHYTATDQNDASIIDLVSASEEAIGITPKVCGSCLSDLSVIGKYNTGAAFAYGCGRDFSLPGGAHQPNEFIECSDLLNFAKVIAAYVIKTLG